MFSWFSSTTEQNPPKEVEKNSQKEFEKTISQKEIIEIKSSLKKVKSLNDLVDSEKLSDDLVDSESLSDEPVIIYLSGSKSFDDFVSELKNFQKNGSLKKTDFSKKINKREFDDIIRELKKFRKDSLKKVVQEEKPKKEPNPIAVELDIIRKRILKIEKKEILKIEKENNEINLKEMSYTGGRKQSFGWSKEYLKEKMKEIEKSFEENFKNEKDKKLVGLFLISLKECHTKILENY